VTTTPLDTIRRLEDCAARAWPAGHVSHVDGWQLRCNDGVTRRANSVLPNRCVGRLPLAEKLSRVEKLYRQWGLPTRYQMSPAADPANLDDVLAARGYGSLAPTAVQAAPLAVVRRATAGNHLAPVTVADRLDGRWLATYCRADGFTGGEITGREGILRRIAQPTGFAFLELEGEPVAVGLGVLDQDWIGIFCMATCLEFRRRGAATAVLHTLAGWGERHAATRAYLQGMDDNAPALALYARAGFETLYHYHYREAPEKP
jgi:GNAT superfamily N-acetyltransferase